MRPLRATEGVVVGLSLLALGALWTLSNLGRLRLDLLTTLATWWPAVLVVWGVIELYNWGATRRAS